MEFYETVSARRSIRKFTGEPVDPAVITRMLEAARLAPSGTNLQPWKFLVVREAATRATLCDAAFGQRFVGDAPAVIVILGDHKAYKKRPRRGKELVDAGAIDPQIIETVRSAYKEREKEPGAADRSVIVQCVIAGEHLALAATAEGLGSCWVMLFKHEEVVAALDLPDQYFPVALMPVGHPAQSPAPRPRYALEEIAFDETMERAWKA